MRGFLVEVWRDHIKPMMLPIVMVAWVVGFFAPFDTKLTYPAVMSIGNTLIIFGAAGWGIYKKGFDSGAVIFGIFPAIAVLGALMSVVSLFL